MTKRPIKDVAASVRARLQANAKATGRPFQEVLQYFAIERFLFRLSRSKHADKFVLKGGLMLTAWRAPGSPSHLVDRAVPQRRHVPTGTLARLAEQLTLSVQRKLLRWA